jgi:hypothetical protein
MTKIAYRFVPCDEEGRQRESSQLTSIHDAADRVEIGSVIAADLLGFYEWEVVELRASSGPLGSANEADGTPIPLRGTLVCRGVERH